MNVEIFLSSGMWLISRGPSVCWLFGSSDVVERNFEQNKMNQTNAVASTSTLVLVFKTIPQPQQARGYS